MAMPEPYRVELWLTPQKESDSRAFDVGLHDRERTGWPDTGSADLAFEDATTRTFLEAFLSGDAVRESQARAFGCELAKRLFASDALKQAWEAIDKRRGGRPIQLTLTLPAVVGDESHAPAPRVALDDIPFELLADEGVGGFWFRRPGWSLVRTFDGLPTEAYELPKGCRALLAWANPRVLDTNGALAQFPQALFDAHEAAFEQEVRALDMEPRPPLRRATLEALGLTLREAPETPLLALVAHGHPKGGAVVLHATAGSDEGVDVTARSFAKVCRDGGVKVALLWSCHGARRSRQRSSVAAALLHPDTGDLAAVIASHAALVAERTPGFAGPLLRSMMDVACGDLGRAVTEARHTLDEDDLQWAAPVYYARPREGRSVSLAERSERVLAEGAIARAAAGREVEGAPGAKPYFRGREDAIERSLGLLEAHKLVTFTGIAGSGKTALAAEVSRWALAEGKLGLSRAVWVDLATRESAGAVREALALHFGLDASATKDDLALAKALGGLRALVVLDNAEDLLRTDADGLRSLVDTLLRNAPGVRMLVTSRRALGQLPGVEEQVFPVGRLPEGVDLEVFLAVAVERLAREGADEKAVKDLVAALGGHPQSIVLVAGQVGRGFSLRELQARVEAEDPEVIRDANLFDDEVGDDRDAQLRTRRLVSSLNLSFRPLMKAAPRTAEMFAWLGTFPAGLPEALVTEVFGPDAKRHASRLLALNMVERRGPEDRLILPGPVRWYARMRQREVIDGGRRAELLERSVAAMAAWLKMLSTKLGKPGAAAACTVAADDSANIGALAAAIEGASSRQLTYRYVASAFEALAWLALFGGFSREAAVVGERVKREVARADSPSWVAVVSAALGDLYMRTDRLREAEGAYGQALSSFRAVKSRLGEANTLRALGDFNVRTARLEEAERAYEQALSIFRALKEQVGEGNTLKGLGDLYVRTARLKKAEEAYEQVLPIFRAVENWIGEANTLRSLGDMHMRTVQLTEAEKAYEQALPIYRTVENRLGEANTLRSLGDLYERTVRLTEAEKAYGQALPIFRAVNNRVGEANALRSLGDLYVETGRLSEAEGVYEQALLIYRAVEDQTGEAAVHQGRGNLALARDEPIESFKHFRGALRIQNATDDDLGRGGTHGYLARAAMLAGHSERAIALAFRALSILRRSDNRTGQMLAATDLVFALASQNDGAINAAAALAWAFARIIDDPRAKNLEPMIREMGIDPDTVPLNELIEKALATLQPIAERYEQILRDRGEDPYSPLPPQ